MIVIRPEMDTDIPGIYTTNRKAFPRPAEAELVDLLRAHGKATLSIVAETEAGQVVGHVLFSPVTIENAPEKIRALGLGPLAVAPEHQRQGIGFQLVKAGLTECQLSGYDLVVLLGDPRYYGRFGFQRASAFGLTNEYGEDEPFQVCELRFGALQEVSGLVRYAGEFADSGC